VTPERVNQARFLLGWSVKQLAKASSLSPSTISTFEAGGYLHPAQLAALRRALTRHGVRFETGKPVQLIRPCPAPLTAEQCQAARKLLGWSQRLLSTKSQVPQAVINTFERAGHACASATTPRLAIIRAALEAGGVEFSTEVSAGVRLPRPKSE
jgi:transcriptional regulator with XRE-family HTH domain